MTSWAPHTPAEIDEMLAFIGVSSLDELFRAVPVSLRLATGLSIPDGIGEPDLMAYFQELAAANAPIGRDLVCFAGGGAYDHEVPAVTKALASRSEFVTAYTPYQAEVAQGVLQALFEYQTMVARLAGLEVANASLYDGAHALVEAVNLAVAATGRSAVWVSEGVNPRWRENLITIARARSESHVIHIVPLEQGVGVTSWSTRESSADATSEPPAAIVVANPNFLGCLEDMERASALASAHGTELIVAFDPITAGIIESPGSAGASVAVGEGQALGAPLSFGGPYLGLFACSMEHVRRIPGRIVGQTVDVDSRTAYVTTLRAREQDIRRERASSNVCTNETLLAIGAAVQMAWLGTSGLAEIALRSARGARYCREALLGIPGVRLAATAPTVREFAVCAPVSGEVIVDRMLDEGFLAGVALTREIAPQGFEGGLLVAVTERRTRAEIDAFAAAFEKAVSL